MIIMEIDLSSIGMERGRQYETIITTKNDDSTKHAAPIGVLCSGPDIIICRIFKGSHTLENILKRKEFYVNITHSPELFTESLVEDLNDDYFGENTLKDADAYFKCEVISFKEAVKQSDPIKRKDEAIVFKSKVVELVIKNETEAFNRGFAYVIESLVNFARFDLVEGGIANDRIFNTIELYSSNLISREETLQRLQYEKPNNQICILSQAVADTYLHFVESSVIVTEEPTR